MLARLSHEQAQALEQARLLIQSNDLVSLDQLLAENSTLCYFHEQTRDTLLGMAALDDNKIAFDKLLSHLTHYSPTDQINTLLLTSVLVSHMEKHDRYRQRLLLALTNLLPHVSEIKTLTLCSAYLSSESEQMVKDIIDKAKVVQHIHFIHSAYINSRWVQTDLMLASSDKSKQGMISLTLPLLIDFCAAILTKRHLTTCNLYGREGLELAMELVDLVLERNRQIDSRCPYADKINEQIDVIASHYQRKANVGVLTDKKLKESKSYSFKELTKFFVNRPREEVGKEKNKGVTQTVETPYFYKKQ